MALIPYTNMEDGQSANANLWNSRFSRIIAEINGKLSAENLANSAVTNPKIAALAVSSDKLDEDFFKGVYMNDTSGGPVDNLRVQFGWGYITGNNAAVVTKDVTFPVPFSEVYGLTVSPVGYKNGSNPTSMFDTTTYTTRQIWSAKLNGGTGMTIAMRANNDTALSNVNRHMFSWIAIGTIDEV